MRVLEANNYGKYYFGTSQYSTSSRIYKGKSWNYPSVGVLANSLNGMKVGFRGDWRFTKKDLLKLTKNNHDNRLTRNQSMKIKQQEKQKENFPVVGIGASAGGLKAVTQLLEAIPADIGMAFMLIQHLDPTKKSLLPETLARKTPLPFVEVEDNTKISPNHIYAMPSESFMTISDGTLKLVKRRKRTGLHNPIDAFFQSLAKHHSKGAIGIVLSGTGRDGTAGIQAIKKSGGKTFAQDDSAEYKGMPQSARDSGSVDFTLSPDEIANKLIQISHEITSGNHKSKPEDQTINAILAVLHTKTGMDFRQYKSTMVNRRIQRRMLLNHIATVKEYTEFLSSNPHEVEALRKDMLIHVTNFFRTPEQFEVLKQSVFPALFKNRSPKRPVNVWIPGCATGEEAYSLAIVIQEFIGKKANRPEVRILGTDIAKDAIEEARKGVYKESITQNVSPARIRKFFTKVNDGYEVKKVLRVMCEFTVHDVTQKPPQLNFYLVSCRNVLIYLGESLQQKVLFMLSSALKPGGFLLLGKSEGLGASAKLFSGADKTLRLYSKTATTTDASSLQKAVNAQVGMDTSMHSKDSIKEADAMLPGSAAQMDHQQKILKLREAVNLTQEYADEIINELDVMNEELQSTNEELASSNEELQTTNEELATSQEELQTANEEMTTLNEELQTRNEEITRAIDYTDAIIKTVRQPLIILDGNLWVQSANESFYETFRVSPKQTENRLLFDLGNKQWDIPKLRELLEKILLQKNAIEDYIVEHAFETIGQKTMLLNARTLLQGPKKTPLILLAIEDISERKKLELRKDDFIALASHELKTPVTSIKMFAQIMGQRFKKIGDGQSVTLLASMDKQLDKLTGLINGLLDMSRVQEGKLVYKKEAFTIDKLIREYVGNIRRITETHKLLFNGQSKMRVEADRDRIGQVLTNLINNAIKYSSKGSKVIISSKRVNDEVVVNIQDFGIGISRKDQRKVFDRFFQASNTTDQTFPGLGLGLYISNEIIRRHNGRLSVDSEQGKGSDFSFTLPIAKSREKKDK